jgi:Flagellar transcriptional activator (FlhC)
LSQIYQESKSRAFAGRSYPANVRARRRHLSKPIVCSLCAIRRKTATLIYRIGHQESPKKGMLPWDQQWIIRSSVNNLHASIFLGLVQDYLPSEATALP